MDFGDHFDGQHELHDLLVISEYGDVFEALEGLSPTRGDVLTIELESGTSPVSRVLYRLAPAEMAELKEHMEDSSDKRFIRPNNSPWGAPVLFVKKKK